MTRSILYCITEYMTYVITSTKQEIIILDMYSQTVKAHIFHLLHNIIATCKFLNCHWNHIGDDFPPQPMLSFNDCLCQTHDTLLYQPNTAHMYIESHMNLWCSLFRTVFCVFWACTAWHFLGLCTLLHHGPRTSVIFITMCDSPTETFISKGRFFPILTSFSMYHTI